MNEIEIYVHTAKHRDPKLIKISEGATIEELLKLSALEAHEGLHVILEGEDEPLGHHRKLHECGVKHRHHIQCHRCRKIEIAVFYNGEKHRAFSPSATIEKVLLWALDTFNLKGADALDKVLRLASAPNEELPEATHVGSLVERSQCELRLNLTGKVEVNG